MYGKEKIVLITPKQYCKIFGVTRSKVQHMLERGPKMSAQKIGGRWQIAVTQQQIDSGRID